jgi:hypothetical protein
VCDIDAITSGRSIFGLSGRITLKLWPLILYAVVLCPYWNWIVVAVVTYLCLLHRLIYSSKILFLSGSVSNVGSGKCIVVSSVLIRCICAFRSFSFISCLEVRWRVYPSYFPLGAVCSEEDTFLK